jgi:succinate-semialdehyde dehydrogenase/glutarate-semialdehyde dehydrogenase
LAEGYTTELKLFIDGEWIGTDGRDTHRVVSPATGDALGDLPMATAADLDRALDTLPWRKARPCPRPAAR